MQMSRSRVVCLLQRVSLMMALLLLGIPPGAAPQVAFADNAPLVTVSPTTVAAGASLTVTGKNFACPSPRTNVTVDLIDSTGKVIVNLGSVSAVCLTFTQAFTVPATVVPGQYQVRATQQGTTVTGTSKAFTVGPASGPIISGTAQCQGSPALALAVVELFSGSVLVATTTADANGKFAFAGTASGATYELRYTSQAGVTPQITCTTTSTNGQVAPAPPCPDQSWANAAPLTSTVAQSVTVCAANGSIWRTIAVEPGQQVSIVLGNPGAHTRLALFKDLNADLQKLLANPTTNLQQLDASMNAVAGSPWNSSPWNSSPWNSSPWNSSPWNSSPWNSSPWNSSPWNSSPVDPAFCTSLSSTASTDACAGGYITVQMQDLLAWSADGQITRNTFDLSGNLSGNFYIRVYNDDGSFDIGSPMTLTATISGQCGVPPQPPSANTLTKVPSSLTPTDLDNLDPNPNNRGPHKTLIFTNTARLLGPNGLPITDTSNAALLNTFTTTVTNFAASPAVDGVLVDLAKDTGGTGGIAKDYQQWDTPPFPSCPAAANIVASALHDLINAYSKQTSSTFQYVTILGGYTVVPAHITPDSAELEPENFYDPGLVDVSKSAATLGNNYVMTDNYYVSFSPINRLESEISLPDANMAVGRIVEFPSDIISVLQTFLAGPNDTTHPGLAKPTSALVTGYTFTQDLATFEVNQLKQSGLSTDSLISDTWSASDLRAKLLGAATPGIVAVNWHASSNQAVAADYTTGHPTTISSSEIADLPPSDTRFNNALIISIGCHLGYPLLNQDLISNPTTPPQFVTEPRAFTETFQSRGAMVLANSGYGYGDTDFIGYGEELLALTTQQLTSGGSSPVPVGLALTNAKRQYIQNSGATTGVDKKSLEELTFYGPPMWAVAVPTPVGQPGGNSLGVNPAPISNAVTPAEKALSADTVTPPYTLTLMQPNGTTFYQADHAATDQAGGTQEIPYRPILPFKAFDATPPPPPAPNAGTARGVALIAADYHDLPSTKATVDVPLTEVSNNARPPWPTPGFWPFQTFGLNELVGQELVTTPIQWQSDDGLSGTTRKYDDSKTTLRVYYSSLSTDAAFAGPASISDVKLSQNGSLLHVDLTVNGSTAAGIFDVLVNYTVPPSAGATGKWKTCSLVPNRIDDPKTTTISCGGAGFTTTATTSTSGPTGTSVSHYFGDINPSVFGTGTPVTSLQLAFQAVTDTGLVSTRNNDGLYYSFVPQTATIGSPKANTSITINSTPLAPVTYGLNATFTATLQSSNPNCTTTGQLKFNLGSQVQTATLTNGSATASFVVLEKPAAYPLIVRFAETPACLGSSALTQATVVKQPTSLNFGQTPYIATLTDANNTPMRERWVYFNFKGTSNAGAAVNASRSAQTDANGVAQLHGMTVPDGSYTVTASFPGSIPTASGVINLSDPYYQSPTVLPTRQFTADRTPPTCTFVSMPTATSIIFLVQDGTPTLPGSGLASISVVGGTFASPPSFVLGAQSAGNVTINSTNLSQATLEIRDVAGNETDCNPNPVTVSRTTNVARRVQTTVDQIASQATIVNSQPNPNNNPGIGVLHIRVNNNTQNINGLLPNTTTIVDLSSLITGANAGDPVVLTAEGKPGGSAIVIFIEQLPIGP
jgi:hypothetical protein